MSVSYIVTNDGTIAGLRLNGKLHSVKRDHTNYNTIKAGLSSLTEQELSELVDISKSVVNYGNGKITVEHGEVLYDGTVLHNTMTDRLLAQKSQGFPVDSMINFLTNLMDNPSMQSVEELYDFLANKNLPITEDGYILAHKAVSSDFKDKWTGTKDNRPGQTVSEPRNMVDDNRGNACSKGLHAGTPEYVRGYGNEDFDKVVLVKINPADVVSVPSVECEKLRVCKYVVLEETRWGDIREKAVYANDGSNYEPPVLDEDHEDDDDYLEDQSNYYEDDYDDNEDEPDWSDILSCSQLKIGDVIGFKYYEGNHPGEYREIEITSITPDAGNAPFYNITGIVITAPKSEREYVNGQYRQYKSGHMSTIRRNNWTL